MPELSPMMNFGQFKAYCLENGVGEDDAHLLFNKLDGMDDVADGQIDLGAIDINTLRGKIAPQRPMDRWCNDKLWGICDKIGLTGKEQFTQTEAMDFVRLSVVAYRQGLQTYYVSMQELPNGEHLAGTGDDDVVFTIGGLPSSLFDDPEGGHQALRLVIDPKSLQDEPEHSSFRPYYGDIPAAFEPKSYEGSLRQIYSTQDQSSRLYVKPYLLHAGLVGDESVWVDIGIGFLALMASAVLAVKGRGKRSGGGTVAEEPNARRGPAKFPPVLPRAFRDLLRMGRTAPANAPPPTVTLSPLETDQPPAIDAAAQKNPLPAEPIGGSTSPPSMWSRLLGWKNIADRVLARVRNIFGGKTNMRPIHHTVESADGTQISLYEKRPKSSVDRSRAILLLHSASFSSIPEYDLRVSDYSLMDYFAANGFRVFAVDIRGYGRSQKLSPDVWVTMDMAVADMSAAVKFVRNYTGFERVDILGWSWGTQVAGRYAQEYPSSVDNLILYAPFWHGVNVEIPEPIMTRRANEPRDILTDFLDRTRVDVKVVNEFVKTCMSCDKTSPMGAWKDLRGLSQNPILDPSRIKNPILIIYGEHDHLVMGDDIGRFFAELTPDGKKMVVVKDTDHMLHLELNRHEFHEAVRAFLLE